MSSLLDEIESDYHQHLLESGNLSRPSSKWTGENSWTSAGYLACVLVTVCKCGDKTSLLQGVFHAETHPAKGRRLTALPLSSFQVPLGQQWPIERTEVQTPVCAACLPSRGFGES